MMNRQSAFAFSLLLLLLLSACTATYSPFTHVPLQPMADNSVEIDATYEGQISLPAHLTDGVRTGLRLGVTDRLMIGGQAWTSDEDFWSASSGGWSVESMLRLGKESDFTPGVHARYSMLLEAGDGQTAIVGHAFQGGLILWTPKIWKLHTHVASEVGYGWNTHALNGESSDSPNRAFMWMQEIGAGIELPLNFQLKGELLSNFYYTIGDSTNGLNYLLMPQITLTWGADL